MNPPLPEAPTEARPRAPLSDALGVAGLALVLRLVVVAWGASRFPPTADGTFYDTVARRIANGFGYTWLWPDGAVTFAAHYPVGYPAAVGALYALVVPHPAVAMVLNAALGALAAFAVHQLTARASSRAGALLAGVLVAVHPGLVGYTPALMTEGATAALIASAAAVAAWARDLPERRTWSGVTVLGLVVGLATLVRPQSLVLAPAFAFLAAARPNAFRWRRTASAAVLATAAALAVCAPWTARNCVRMHSCALVSVNAGWNLLIGADTASTGAWSPIKVPERCREVWDEAGKDACFGAEARRFITENPAAWLALVPRKLGATFDYAGAAGWYLHESNPAAFTDRDKLVLGAVETVFERIVILVALFGAAHRTLAVIPEGARARRILVIFLAASGALPMIAVHAWLGYVAFALVCLLRGRSFVTGDVLTGATAVTVLATIVTHATFFGAGRYSMVVFPLLTGAAAEIVARTRWFLTRVAGPSYSLNPTSPSVAGDTSDAAD